MAPDTEAPEEFHFYIPELKALTCAENANHSMHNIQTLRGARTRDAANFARYLDEAIDLFGADVEVHYGPHTWPVWGHDGVVEFLSSQRDAYKYLHDETLRLANHGLHPVEISEALRAARRARSRGVVEPRLPRHAEAQRTSRVPQGARLLRRQPGQPRPAAAGRIGPAVGGGRSAVPTRSSPPPVTRSPPKTTAGSSSSPARPCSPIRPTPTPAAVQADAFEQLGFQAEGPQWRNIYLTAAQELREGVAPVERTSTRGVVESMPPDIFFDLVAVRLNGPKAEHEDFTINLTLTDVDGRTRSRSATACCTTGHGTSPMPTSCCLERSTLIGALSSPVLLDAAIDGGAIEVDGDVGVAAPPRRPPRPLQPLLQPRRAQHRASRTDNEMSAARATDFRLS